MFPEVRIVRYCGVRTLVSSLTLVLKSPRMRGSQGMARKVLSQEPKSLMSVDQHSGGVAEPGGEETGWLKAGAIFT